VLEVLLYGIRVSSSTQYNTWRPKLKMSNLFRKALRGQRFSSGTWQYGKWVEGTPVTIDFLASVQPTSAHDLLFLEEGRRERKSYTLFTDYKLLCLAETGDKNPDRVTIDDVVYEVVIEAPWRNNVINHYKYIVQKIQAIEA
jgi:hypothetical protein